MLLAEMFGFVFMLAAIRKDCYMLKCFQVDKQMPVSIAIKRSQLEEVRQESSKRNLSMSAYVTKALEYYKKSIEKPLP